MKKTLTVLCSLALALCLVGCGGKIREAENYRVGEYEGGWSILYEDEEGLEEIAALGSAPQPLVLQGGRLYFTAGGKLVSVDSDGGDRQEVAIGTMEPQAVITFVDEENFYCMAGEGPTCWRISKADSADHEEVTIPRALRPTDYAALAGEIRRAAQPVEDKIRVRSGWAELDSNGSLRALELEILRYDGETKSMAFWDTGRLSVTVSHRGATAAYTEHHIPLSLGEGTLNRLVTLEEFLAALEAADNSQCAVQTAQGEASGFRLAYLQDAFDDGAKTAPTTVLNQGEHRFVLAQRGAGSLEADDGSKWGNLQNLEW